MLGLLLASTIIVSCGATKEVPASQPPRTPSSDEIDFFEKRIRPVLVQHCYACHSHNAKSLEGGLLMDSRAGMLKGGDDGPVIVPGKPEASNLIKAIRYGQDFSQMPPKGKLPAEVIADFERWIVAGAPDPRGDDSPLTKLQDKHWAFQPPRQVPLPLIKHTDWPRSEVDRFVLARLEERGLSPAPDANRDTLIRRLSFDLIGLPPMFSEVETFVNDRSPQALDSLIDRLLASPHFGERWARHWLDVARYADTKGYVFQEDRNYSEAYTYRDWVIEAFNEDMPYDRFLTAQIAGDQMPAPGKDPPLAAMGFLTLGRRFINNVHDIIDDRIDVVTRGMMALTVSCARCHDHKYDPIPTKDYYSLYGVFASSSEPNNAPSRLRLIDAPQPHNARVFLRGNPNNPGEEVPRQFLRVLAGENRKPFQRGSGRLELAQAIAHRDNPLTARVFVNRVWGHLFGAGLVRTPSDFGARCDPPTHPELLDYLALQFVDEGWSVKKLVRRIVLSRTYRQRSEDRPECSRVDPENFLLWKMNRRRLDFESLRDAILAVSGRLDGKVGGPSVSLTTTPFTSRRTLYAFIDRQNLPGLFRTFDFASPDTHSPQRFNTTVPQQALFLMNNPFVLEESQAVSRRAEMGGDVGPQRHITLLYQLVYARKPSADEVRLGVEFITQNSRAEARSSRPSRWESYAQVLMLANEFAFVD
jgi:mono/diheme cytochrome c family protein